MFRASSAYLQEDTVVYMQHMVLSLSMRFSGGLSVHSLSDREWGYHVLHVYNCILLKMSTWGSKHVEEESILWINNNQCIKLVSNSWCTVRETSSLYSTRDPPLLMTERPELSGFCTVMCIQLTLQTLQIFFRCFKHKSNFKRDQ